jgi:hypothetical protein
MEVIKLQMAENLKEKQHVWCEEKMEVRSYNDPDRQCSAPF